MMVGVCTLELQLPAAHSLKDKRRIIKSLTAHLHQKFNVSVAEVGLQDAWGAAEIGVACVSTDSRHAQSILTEVVKSVENSHLDFVLVDYFIEIL